MSQQQHSQVRVQGSMVLSAVQGDSKCTVFELGHWLLGQAPSMNMPSV
jgi:hypothetical protein